MASIRNGYALDSKADTFPKRNWQLHILQQEPNGEWVWWIEEEYSELGAWKDDVEDVKREGFRYRIVCVQQSILEQSWTA